MSFQRWRAKTVTTWKCVLQFWVLKSISFVKIDLSTMTSQKLTSWKCVGSILYLLYLIWTFIYDEQNCFFLEMWIYSMQFVKLIQWNIIFLLWTFSDDKKIERARNVDLLKLSTKLELFFNISFAKIGLSIKTHKKFNILEMWIEVNSLIHWVKISPLNFHWWRAKITILEMWICGFQ